ncbi:MAG: FliA/WhiG family RNA polymerase sigma factor [Deltaproteobacteria bacterium]|jgi:RNA polymerase sigma factor for flagellar operon FliA|nr:FliA/WhiG family RNA polymerase sigma factor [Deltaproteobacteria bacterium]
MSESLTYGPSGPAAPAPDKPGWRSLSMAEKTEYVEKYAPLVRYVANRLAARLPGHVVKDDLVSSGVLGLIDAVDRYDAERGLLFKTYAEIRIRGAMLDYLRTLDWVPRSLRKKVNDLEKLWRELEQKLGHPPSDEECAEAMGVKIEAYLKLLDEVNIINIFDLDAYKDFTQNDGDSANIYEILADENGVDALAALGRAEASRVLAEAIEALPEKEKQVVALYYHEELQMREIGMVMGYTESRISQLHTKAVIHLRSALNSYFEELVRGGRVAVREKTRGRTAARVKSPAKEKAAARDKAPAGGQAVARDKAPAKDKAAGGPPVPPAAAGRESKEP